jgi:ATP/maltotriose-dependent transcriptional regulator MalT
MPERQFKQIVIQTKLNRPAIGANSVERPRLISRLDDALKGRVTLISAPAGYGSVPPDRRLNGKPAITYNYLLTIRCATGMQGCTLKTKMNRPIIEIMNIERPWLIERLNEALKISSIS